MDANAPLLAGLLLAALAFAAAPAAATGQPVDLGCSGTGVGDHDSDGVPETSGTCTTPPCGCNCPVVGAGVDLVARGQEARFVLLTGCGYWLDYEADPNDVDWDGPVTVEPQGHCYPGGGPDFCTVH